MFSVERDKDTICAVATPPGIGGISVIRLSGKDSNVLIKKICTFIPEHVESHRVYYGYLTSVSTGEKIDEVLVTYFKQGRSFTGEETYEVSSHGSPTITQNILSELVEAGARMAEPGEFTYRAFMSGRIDLVQAESVLSLIEAESKKSARLSLRQLEGTLSNKLKNIEDRMTLVLAHLEANIDFASEDIEIEASGSLKRKIEAILSEINELLASYKDGHRIQHGIRVALVGPPNVGKSSLLNALCGEEKAIVTNIPGTTRDFVEGKLSINGQLVHLIDTAGLRGTDDEVESIGIKRTLKILEEVDEAFVLLDLSKPILEQLDPESGLDLEAVPVTLIANKVDIQRKEYSDYPLSELLQKLSIEQGPGRNILKTLLNLPDDRVIKVSAQGGQGIQSVHEHLRGLTSKEFSESSAMISQARHFELLTEVRKALLKTIEQFEGEDSPEFIAFELQESLKLLHELLGKTFDDEVMDRVFKEFCLGK